MLDGACSPMTESKQIRAHKTKGYPGEVDDDVEVADESFLDASRRRGGRALEEAPAVPRVEEGLGVDGAEETRLVLLQRLPRPVVRVSALPCLKDAALGGIFFLLVVVLVMVAATLRGGGGRVEPATADAVHDVEAAGGRRRRVGSGTGGGLDKDMGQAGCAGLGWGWACFFLAQLSEAEDSPCPRYPKKGRRWWLQRAGSYFRVVGCRGQHG
jgi:hypothetical protein